jgi:two-component system chemotaxis sensor kinase CheA
LTHLVRNSIDHGIETPALRQQCGKREIGQLRLSAAHQGSHIVLVVQDDGVGLDRERILAKARSQGHALDEGLSDEEVWQLIFLPGVSTAKVVTDVSGRGVGMDVVRRNIQALGGSVSVTSARGKGTTTRISLPLTLAILDGMSVRAGVETYMLPLSQVVESFQPRASEVKSLNSQGLVVRVRGEYLPIISLASVFGTASRSFDPASGILVIIAGEALKAALWVDELLGQQQVVVKNIETNYRRVPNVSGATILGDGSVALIVDVCALLAGAWVLSPKVA